MVDLDTGDIVRIEADRDPPAALGSQDYDNSGLHLIRTLGDGAVRAWMPDGEMAVLGHGYLAAAW